MRELNIVEASWSMDAAGSWLKLRPELPGQAQMVAGEFDPQKKYTVTIKEFRKKRSLDANAYAWVLMNKLADKLNMGVRDLYLQSEKAHKWDSRDFYPTRGRAAYREAKPFRSLPRHHPQTLGAATENLCRNVRVDHVRFRRHQRR